MKKSMPIAGLFFAFAVILAAAYVFKAGSSPKETPAPEPQAAAAPVKNDGWKIYEDKSVKLQYPPKWEVRFLDDVKASRHTWTVRPPNWEWSDTGQIKIRKKLDGKEKRPLKQILGEANWEDGRVGEMQPLSLRGMDCLFHAIEFDWKDVYVEADGRTRIQRRCIKPYRDAACYTDAREYVRVHSKQGMYCDRQQPDKETQAYIDIYDRVLRSIQFKKS
ncbi:hypothetical protein ACFL2T_07880 [Elusimicrobiota bacterium]